MKIKGVLSNTKRITGTLVRADDAPMISLSGTLRYTSSIPTYNGVYSVTPNSNEQVLETRGLKMRQDVSVKPIPYFETTNDAGGYTVIIGE